MRNIAGMILSLPLGTLVSPARADEGNDDDEHENESVPDDDKGHTASGNEDAPHSPVTVGNGSSRKENDDEDEEENEENALRAVQADKALPLRDIIRIFREQIDGKIIDIALYKRRLRFVYRFQYINENGYVAFVIYEAATGIRLEEQ